MVQVGQNSSISKSQNPAFQAANFAQALISNAKLPVFTGPIDQAGIADIIQKFVDSKGSSKDRKGFISAETAKLIAAEAEYGEGWNVENYISKGASEYSIADFAANFVAKHTIPGASTGCRGDREVEDDIEDQVITSSEARSVLSKDGKTYPIFRFDTKEEPTSTSGVSGPCPKFGTCCER